MREILNSMIKRYPGKDLMETAAARNAAASSSRLDCIAAPTLVITGDQDLPSRVAAANTVARQVPGAERAVIRTAAHLPNLDNRIDYNTIVRGFLERHTSSLRRPEGS